MGKFNIRSTGNALVAPALILAVLARLPIADGLLLHNHSDHGVHSHTVTLDDLRDGEQHASWHSHHDDTPDGDDNDRNNESKESKDSDSGEHTESLLIFVSDPAMALGIHCPSGAVIASMRHPSATVLPRSMLPSDSTGIARFLASTWPSAHPRRPASALDALLQSSRALLL